MNIALSPAVQRLFALLGASVLLIGAVAMPEWILGLVPALVLVFIALAFYQFPRALAFLLILSCGLGIDIQAEMMGGASGSVGLAVVKTIPFALGAVLLMRYGPAREINWPFLTFLAVAGISIVILPIGHIATEADMLRTLIGSTAPFVLGFVTAPRRVWTMLIRGATVVPIISVVASGITTAAGTWPAIDIGGRFQGMHIPPFLAGFCVTAVFAATLEYLRGFRVQWLIIGGIDLAILMLTQARAPLISIGLFLGVIFVLSGQHIFPLKRKVDLAIGGMVPGMLALGPALYFALDRVANMSDDMSGRDIIWPYFLDAIRARPLFGFGLGAGKLIVNPEDPTIRLLGSNAAHNEYLRLSVDAGIIGCAGIFLSIIAWIWIGSTRVPPTDRLVLRAGLAAALLHSGFDNTLIASTALMQFSFFAAAMARGRQEWRESAARRARQGRREPGLEEGTMSATLARRARG